MRPSHNVAQTSRLNSIPTLNRPSPKRQMVGGLECQALTAPVLPQICLDLMPT